jgi:formate hydrogenlyase transcriptional activator
MGATMSSLVIKTEARERETLMLGSASDPMDGSWLQENGPKQLELLFRAVVYYPSAPILIADNHRNHRDASYGAGKLLGLSRDRIIGRCLDEFVDPGSQALISDLWQAFLRDGKQEGTLRLRGPDGQPLVVEYSAKKDLLPVRHLLVLRDKTAVEKNGKQGSAAGDAPPWIQDYALFLLDAAGKIVAWYSGAERIYGYSAADAIGQPVDLLYPSEDLARAKLEEELKRSAAEGHFGTECWCLKRDRSSFWASVVTMALRDDAGGLQGFARVVRDFTQRHDRDEKLRNTRAVLWPLATENSIPGIVSGEFDRIPEANDAFLDLVGYSREDLASGRLHWPELTPDEFAPLDELAHEEGLRFGACTPFEKELTRKDGSRVPVLVATAVLKLSPFRWITFVQDLRDRNQQENPDEPAVTASADFDEIVGRGASMRRLLGLIEVVAPTNATVLVLGETGTGKELVARAVHRRSPRRDRPFVTLNCAAIPTGLLESELFGYERGAFTGALSQKIGRFEMAHRGTLFLDEVGDIPLDLQPKLLRALQEKTFERLGGTKTIPIDVRLVAATNRNLTQMMGDKLFRSDLYYRLKVFPITTPPLRDHAEDIPLLVRHFTQKFAREMERTIKKIPSETMRALVGWSWPGNVRELENFIERAVILSRGSNLEAPLSELLADSPESASAATLHQMEREHILRVLRETGGVVSRAAVRLGTPRTTLNALMRKLGIFRKDI